MRYCVICELYIILLPEAELAVWTSLHPSRLAKLSPPAADCSFIFDRQIVNSSNFHIQMKVFQNVEITEWCIYLVDLTVGLCFLKAVECVCILLHSSTFRNLVKMNGKCGFRLNASAVCRLVHSSSLSWCVCVCVCVSACVYSWPPLGWVCPCVTGPNLVLSAQSLSLMCFCCCCCFLPCSNKALQSNLGLLPLNSLRFNSVIDQARIILQAPSLNSSSLGG